MTATTIRLFGTAPDSIVDGPGLRFAIFTQGCSHRCPGCHNPESQPACGGTLQDIDALAARIAANKLVQGVTISGGEPFDQAAACAELAQRAHALGLNVWTYSGYRYEDLVATPASGALPPVVDQSAARILLDNTDVLIDGPFVEALHSYDLPWRGSSNQRLIDLVATRKQSCLVLWENEQEFPTKPASW